MPLDGRKSLRQLEVSDVLWRTFERMAEEQEKGVDELVSDAMVAFAQLSGYQTGISENEMTPPPTPAPVAAAAPMRAASITGASLPPPGAPRPGRAAAGGGLASAPPPLPLPPPPPRLHPHASTDTPAGGAAAVSPPLYLVFDNQKYRIDKDQFIIGRGAKSSDLPIKDGNISRKHAAVIRRNGTYFIKDLGSTNGIDYKGMRIDNKRIDEGDIFHLCDYELRFTYKR
jgi:hypothetical protein